MERVFSDHRKEKLGGKIAKLPETSEFQTQLKKSNVHTSRFGSFIVEFDSSFLPFWAKKTGQPLQDDAQLHHVGHLATADFRGCLNSWWVEPLQFQV